MNFDLFIAEAVKRGWELTSMQKDSVNLANWRADIRISHKEIEETDDETLLRLLDERDDGDEVALLKEEIARLRASVEEIGDELRSAIDGEFEAMHLVEKTQSVIRAAIEHMEAGYFPVPGELRALLDDDDELRWPGEMREVPYAAGHRLSEPLRESDLAYYWKRYELAADEGYLSQQPPWDRVSITPREFRRLLVEINDLHKQIARLEKRMADELRNDLGSADPS